MNKKVEVSQNNTFTTLPDSLTESGIGSDSRSDFSAFPLKVYIGVPKISKNHRFEWKILSAGSSGKYRVFVKPLLSRKLYEEV